MKQNLFFTGIMLIALLNSCNLHRGSEKFDYSLIPVQSDEKWGFIDKSGKYLINPQFKDAYLFSDGLAVVQSADEKMGYISTDGKFAINPIYKYATIFSEGYAFVTPENGYPSCIDKKGEIKFVLKEAKQVSVFKDGLAIVQIKDKFGFVDFTGKLAINPQFDIIGYFSEGLASFGNRKNKESEEVSYGFIDKSGKIIINAQFKSVGEFKEGKALVWDGKKYGFINPKGLYVINPQFDDALEFSDGLAAVKQGDSWGFIDKEGKIVINPQFEDVSSFKNGLAPVRSGKENWGYVNKEGKYAVNPQFKAASKFYSDFAIVVSGDKIGLIDKEGKYLVNPQFSNSFVQYFDWANSLYEFSRFEAVKSDFYDISELSSAIFIDADNGQFRGFSSNATLRMVVDDSQNTGVVKEHNLLAVINPTEKSLTKDVDLKSVIYYFKSPIYSYEPQYYYGYNVGTEKQYNFSVMLEAVEANINLKPYSEAYGKGSTIAEGLKAFIIKKYNATEVKSNSSSNAGSSVVDTTAAGYSDSFSDHIVLNSSKMEYIIGYSENEVSIYAKFK